MTNAINVRRHLILPGSPRMHDTHTHKSKWHANFWKMKHQRIGFDANTTGKKSIFVNYRFSQFYLNLYSSIYQFIWHGVYFQMNLWCIDNILEQTFSIIFIRCFVVIVRHSIYLWLFVAFRHSVKIGMVKKHDFKTLVTGTVFGGYFNVRNRLMWELKLFLFDRIEMMLEYKITVCVIWVW